MLRFLALLVVVFTMVTANVVQAEQDYIWREAETADSSSFQIKTDTGSAEFSEGAWLKECIPDGGVLSYDVDVKNAGKYTLWLRIGFEYVRANMQWRVDGGSWNTITSKDLTTNLTFIYFWTELGWYQAAQQELGAGKHILEIKFGPKTGENFVAGFDCLCLVKGDWVPDGYLKPNEILASETDTKAAANVFTVPEASRQLNGDRQVVTLNGLWQISRDDRMDMNADRYSPIRELPDNLHWRGISVPGDYATQLGPLGFAHTVWYKCQIDVPETYAGRSFILDFTGTNWITSVVVNGKFMGWSKLTRVPWQLDITDGISAGKVNDIWVGIKDIYYAIDRENLIESRNIPMEALTKWPPHFVTTVYPTTKGDSDGLKCGITDPVSLVITGSSTYVSDVFVKTTVTDADFKSVNKTITAEITLTNPTDSDKTVEVSAQIYRSPDKIAKTLAGRSETVPANGSKTVTLADKWPEAELWWPQDDPAAMYTMKVSLKSDNAVGDIYNQPFGFREVKIDGKYIRINGVRRNFWNLLSGFQGDTDSAKLEHFYKANNRFERFGADIGGQTGYTDRKQQLDWADKHGIAGRLSTMIDGMFITYTLENPVVWENFREHVQQVVKNNRNHPSVVVYSLENELLMINGSNIHSPQEMDKIEDTAYQYLYMPAKEIDPTRPVMLDGAGALKNQSLDICNTHYNEDGFHPDNSCPLDKVISRDRWIWDMKRPYCAGEIAYFAGNNSDHAWIGGEAAMEGKTGALKSYAKYLKYLFERYRWNDVSMICPWTGQDNTEECWSAMSDLAAFVREYNTNFYSGQIVNRRVKVFNDTFSSDPVTFKWRVVVNGKVNASGGEKLRIEPGFNRELSISFKAPTVSKRTDCQLILEVTQPGKAKAFKDVKRVVIFPRIRNMEIKRPVYAYKISEGMSAVLKSMGIKYSPVRSMSEVKKPGGIVVMGRNSIAAGQSLADLLDYAAKGGRVIILEHDTPILGDRLLADLKIGVDLEKKPYSAYFAFGQKGSSLLSELDSVTLSNWAGETPASMNVWEKTSGAVRSWITCGPGLSGTTLIELPSDKGDIIATQMRVEEKIGYEPAAQVLMANMLKRADSYMPASGAVGIYATEGELTNTFGSLNCNLKSVKNLAKGLNAKSVKVLAVNANASNLSELNKASDKLKAYFDAGGYVMLCGLQPESLAEYNRLLGTKHILREFRRESVRLLPDMLTAGISVSDIAQFTDEVIAPWSGQRNVSREMFTYCVDGENIAPFCFGKPNPEYSEANGNGAYNLVNNLFNADMWWYIDQISYDPEKSINELVTFNLPTACKLKSITVWNNKNYDTVKGCEVRLDGKPAAKVELPDSYDPTEVALNGALAKSSVSLYSTSVRKHGDSKLVGLDEVKIVRELPDWYQGKVYPLESSGGLVRYPKGRGGFILNQLKFTGTDTPENLTKKKRILATMLQNLGIAFKSAGPSETAPQQSADPGLPNYIPPIGQENIKKK